MYNHNVEYTEQGGNGESTGTDIVYVMCVFSIALLVRWIFSGTIWGAWYRKILTVFIAIFAFGGFSCVFADLTKSDNLSKKGGEIF